MACDRCSDSSSGALAKIILLGSIVYGALYYFKKLNVLLEEEALARHSGGESDYERRHPESHQHHPPAK